MEGAGAGAGAGVRDMKMVERVIKKPLPFRSFKSSLKIFSG